MDEVVEEIEEIHEGEVFDPGTEIVQVSAPQQVTAHQVILCPCCGFKFLPGEASIPNVPFPEPDNPSKGMKLTTRVKQILNERQMNGDGTWNYRFDNVAQMFVKAMEAGHMPTILEFLNRLEGRVAVKLANSDGTNLKLYGSSVPLDGPEAP
jgi:hypothetical protein